MLCDAAAARDWLAVEAGLGRIADPAVHLSAFYDVSQAAQRSFLEEVFVAEPASAPAGALLARRLVHDGWGIRTGSWARDVSQEQWKGFFEHLHRAEQILIDVTARYPEYTSAWIARLDTARGLSLGQAEARRRYMEIMKVVPHFYAAQSEMIQQLCPKWGGSYEAMHGFAVECTKQSPPGSVNGAVVAKAHIEHWLLERRDNRSEAVAYLKRPEVQQELAWAAGHSVLNPAARQGSGWVGAHCSFAMVFSLAENYPAAAMHFDALYTNGNLGTRSPWNYLGDAAAQFVTHRDRAFREGQHR